MAAANINNALQRIPVLLLKTKSNPGDAYEELFSAPAPGGFVFEPTFLPVLEHRFKIEGLARIQELLHAKQIGASEGCAYGGLIFTSQRAVEAFSGVVEQDKGPSDRQSFWHISHMRAHDTDLGHEQAIKDGLTYKTCLSTVSGPRLPER